MVRIVNGEIVPDSPVRQRNTQTPEARPFPNAWNNNPSHSSSNQNAQQYQYVHPDPPPQANNPNDQFAWLEQTRTIFGQRMKMRDLLIIALISCFLFGLPTTVLLGVFVWFGSTNAVNQRIQNAQQNRGPTPTQGNSSVIGSFISSFITPPTPQEEQNDPQNQQNAPQ